VHATPRWHLLLNVHFSCVVSACTGMFKLPHVAPQQQVDSTTHTADSIFISEAGILRFARDYGLTPYVASTKQVRVYLSAIFQCAV
jgi:hypothetical protein